MVINETPGKDCSTSLACINSSGHILHHGFRHCVFNNSYEASTLGFILQNRTWASQEQNCLVADEEEYVAHHTSLDAESTQFLLCREQRPTWILPMVLWALAFMEDANMRVEPCSSHSYFACTAGVAAG